MSEAENILVDIDTTMQSIYDNIEKGSKLLKTIKSLNHVSSLLDLIQIQTNDLNLLISNRNSMMEYIIKTNSNKKEE